MTTARRLSGITRRALLALLAAPLLAPAVRAGTHLPRGRVFGLTTLTPAGDVTEATSLFRLDLSSGEVAIQALPELRLGHSLVPVDARHFCAVPYGHGDIGALLVDHTGNVSARLDAPPGHGFGGHCVALPGQRSLVVHFNASRPDSDRGMLARYDLRTGATHALGETAIRHAHDMILTGDGRHVVIADDGTRDGSDGDAPFVLEALNPALYFYRSGDLGLDFTIPLPINGSFVHIAEDPHGRVIAGVEQYARRNAAGLAALAAVPGIDVEAYVAGFGTDTTAEEIPVPGPLVSVDPNSRDITRHVDIRHQDPFDVALNTLTGTVCNVFTVSAVLSRLAPSQAWTYHATGAWGLRAPMGLADVPGTPLMVVNDYRQGLGVFDCRTMSAVRRYDTPTQGIKHLTYVA